MTDTPYTACIVAAGRGTRAGAGPAKQFRSLGGKAVLAWSIEAFAAHPDCQQIIIAIPPGGETEARAHLGALSEQCIFIEGGQNRSQSVANAVRAATNPYVLVHDAARPLVTHPVINALLTALESYDGAAPCLPVVDALAQVQANTITAVDRTPFRRIQTPQAFHTDRLTAAFERHHDADFPDELSLAQADGMQVTLTEGDEQNFKLTWPEDFDRAEGLLMGHSSSTLQVTGMGYDVHRLAPGAGVHLCGTFIECDLQLIGHSDADAGLHAITDALLGAAALGDIGDHFPPTDPQWKGADSAMFLAHAVKIAGEAGAKPVHCDVTLICERPKIGPHKQAMKARVAEILGLPPNRVNIKATTTEKLGFTGRGEGLAAEAVVTCTVEDTR